MSLLTIDLSESFPSAINFGMLLTSKDLWRDFSSGVTKRESSRSLSILIEFKSCWDPGSAMLTSNPLSSRLLSTFEDESSSWMLKRLFELPGEFAYIYRFCSLLATIVVRLRSWVNLCRLFLRIKVFTFPLPFISANLSYKVKSYSNASPQILMKVHPAQLRGPPSIKLCILFLRLCNASMLYLPRRQLVRIVAYDSLVLQRCISPYELQF